MVAGTHGKTTTTSLLAFLLDRAGQEPSFLVGGVPVDFGQSYRLGRGPAFVVEGDEYDSAFFDKRPKFLHYLPDVAILGNLEFDHADIYPDLAAVQTAFRRLMGIVPRSGLIVAGVESEALREILPGAPCPVETFAVEGPADWRAVELRTGPGGTHFRLVLRGEDKGEFHSRLAGEHNVRNALAALAVAARVGVGPELARPLLSEFRGVKRRLEVRGQVRGVTVYDDFAHHPSAVRETLKAVRAMVPAGTGRIVAVFEPRSYTSRTRVFEAEFARSFACADRVMVSAAHLPGKVPEALRLSEADLVAAIRREGTLADLIPGVPEIVARLRNELRDGDRVVVLSNGGFGQIHERLLEALGHGHPGSGRADPAVV